MQLFSRLLNLSKINIKNIAQLCKHGKQKRKKVNVSISISINALSPVCIHVTHTVILALATFWHKVMYVFAAHVYLFIIFLHSMKSFMLVTVLLEHLSIPWICTIIFSMCGAPAYFPDSVQFFEPYFQRTNPTFFRKCAGLMTDTQVFDNNRITPTSVYLLTHFIFK